MKRVINTCVVAACLATFASEEASNTNTLTSANAKAWSVAVSTDVVSDYILRGQICSDTPVSQNSLTLGWSFEEYGAVYANVWTSHFLTHKGHPRKSLSMQELDYTASYVLALDPFVVSVGNAWYTYPNQSYGSTEELFVSASLPNDYVTPSVAAYWDYLDTYGNRPSAVYIESSLSHTFKPIEKLSVTPAFTLGLSDAAYVECYSWGAVNKSEFSNANLDLAFAYSLSENITLGAYVKYAFTPSHTLRRANYMGNGKDQILYGGFSLALAF